jgi:sec-independent protein translocase protein TatA
MFKQFGAPELLIVAVLILLLFGAKRLPDAARGLGRSLRIFKAETKGLTDDTPAVDAAPAVDPAPAQADPVPTDSAPTERAEG